jgi:uncharacterized protein (UPF0218 family)
MDGSYIVYGSPGSGSVLAHILRQLIPNLSHVSA